MKNVLLIAAFLAITLAACGKREPGVEVEAAPQQDAGEPVVEMPSNVYKIEDHTYVYEYNSKLDPNIVCITTIRLGELSTSCAE